MTRLFAALALVSVPYMVSAADKPLPVTVTNPVLPVEVSNANPIPVSEPPMELFQEFKIDVDCDAPEFCNMAFAPVPAGKRLVVTHIGAFVDVVGTSHPYCTFGTSSLAPTHYLLFQTGPVASGVARLVANQSVLRYFDPDETPRIYCSLTGTGHTFEDAIAATISGHFVDAP